MTCNETISVAKEYNIKHHYDTYHNELYSCIEGKLIEEKLQTLKNSVEKQQVLTTFIKSKGSVTRTSYQISFLLAKQSKPFTDESLVRDCMIYNYCNYCNKHNY